MIKSRNLIVSLKYALLFCAAILITGCDDPEDQLKSKEKKYEIARKQAQERSKLISNEIFRKYSARAFPRYLLGSSYSYQWQKYFIDSTSSKHAFPAYLVDVYESNNVIYAEFQFSSGGFLRKGLTARIVLTVNSDQLKKLIAIKPPYYFFQQLMPSKNWVVANIKNVKRIKTLKFKARGSDVDDAEVALEEYGGILIEGKFVDYFIPSVGQKRPNQ